MIMTVKKKIIITVFIVVSIFLALQVVMDYRYILPTIEKMEQELVEKDLKRVVMAVSRELDQLSFFCRGWAEWDDSYQFLLDHNSEFIASNLGAQSFINNRMALVYFIDLSGRVVWGHCYSHELGEFISIKEFPGADWPVDHFLLRHRQRGSVSKGYMRTSEGVMMVVARPVVPSSTKGEARGTLIVGRIFCDNCINVLRERTQVDLVLWPIDSDAMSHDACHVKDQLGSGSSTYIDRDKDWIFGYTVFSDFFERPVLLLRTKTWRSVYKEVVDGFVADIFFHLAAGLLMVLLLSYFLHCSIGRPLAVFSKSIAEIKSGGQMKPVDIHASSGEIRHLQFEFNQMAQRLLDDSQKREQFESDLKVSKESLRAVLNAAPDGILTLDEKGLIRSVNPAAEQMFGYPRDGMQGAKILSLVAVQQQAMLREEIVKFLQDPENSVFTLGVEITAVRADGSNLLVHCKANSVVIGGEERVICIVRDVSGLKEIHEKLMRTKHLASIGEMGASIAHEIRNPLAGISGAVQVLSDLSSEEKPEYLILKEVRQLTERIAGTVVQILEYANDWQLKPKLCQVTTLIEETVADYSRHAKLENIDIRVKGSGDIRALIDPDLIGQVLVNLIENSIDSYSGEPGELLWQVRKGSREVYITLKDNGSGIQDDLKEDIFKPFFTTKERGNGLGLAICQKIIEKHNGTIFLESQVGVGSKVTIVLPKSKFLQA